MVVSAALARRATLFAALAGSNAVTPFETSALIKTTEAGRQLEASEPQQPTKADLADGPLRETARRSVTTRSSCIESKECAAEMRTRASAVAPEGRSLNAASI